MGTIRYTLRTDHKNKDGLSPIELIYQIKSSRKYFRTKVKLFAKNWIDKDQVAIYIDRKTAKKLLPTINYDLLPSSKEVDDTNNTLGALRNEIAGIENKFESNKVVYSVEMVINELKNNRSPTTKTDAPTNQVFDFIDNYIKDNSASREPGSLSVYKSLKNHLQTYQIEKKKRVTFDGIDYAFFLDFQNFLIGRTKIVAGKEVSMLGNVTIAKQLSTLKTFLNYARMNGIEVSNKYKDFSIKKENLEVIALTNDEFETLYNMDLSKNKKLDQVRDVFCFSCATGLRYSDLSQLKREHIKNNEIRFTVTKTKEPLCIPLNPYSHSILEKYSDRTRPLPVISNQKTNEYVKELCELAEINDMVQIVRFHGAKREENSYPKYQLATIHLGRKTFATLSLERGMSAEEVMKIGGWASYSSFSRYVKITEQRTKIVMRSAWGEIKIQKLKAV